ncbi:MAG: hypothetical protein NVS3B20_17730 [Polyangiales bacterium]
MLTYDATGWYMRSWNCCKYGSVFASPVVPVKTGDSLAGTMQGSSCNTAGACNSWKVNFTDQTTAKSTQLSTTVGGEVMNWTFGGVLEAYGITDCAQLPASGAVTFTSISAKTPQGATVALPWSTSFDSAVSPQCKYGVSVYGASVTLHNYAGTTAGIITVLPATPSNPTVARGKSVPVTFNWNGGPTQVANTVFVHVYGPAYYGFDYVPSKPTTSWSGAQAQVDTLSIPLNAPIGTYAINVGLYDPSTGARRPLNIGAGVTTGNDGSDSYRVGTLTIK